jgi:hypothetical protein
VTHPQVRFRFIDVVSCFSFSFRLLSFIAILRAKGEPVVGKTVAEATALLRGEADSEVSVECMRGKMTITADLERQSTPVLEGFLLKRGGVTGSAQRKWNKRFIMMRKAQLYYFKANNSCTTCTHDTLCTDCQNCAELKGCLQVISANNLSDSDAGQAACFAINGDDRSVVCQCESAGDRAAWVTAISNALR